MLSNLFVMSGIVNSVQGLLTELDLPDPTNVSDIGAYPKNYERVTLAANRLSRKLNAYIKENKLLHKNLSPGQWVEIAEEAAELRPKLLIVDSFDPLDFRKEIVNRYKKERKLLNKFFAVFMGMALIAIIFLYVTQERYFSIYIGSFSYLTEGAIYNLALEIINLVLITLRKQILLAVVILLTGTGLLFFAYTMLTRFQEITIKTWLFNRAGYRDFYMQFVNRNLKPNIAAFWVTALIFLFIIFSLINSFLNQIGGDFNMIDLMRDTYWALVIGGVSMSAVISMPYLGFVYQRVKRDRNLEDPVFKSYFVYVLSKALLLPVITLLMINVVLPGSFMVNNKLQQKLIYPSYQHQIDDFANRIYEYDVQTDSDQYQIDRIISAIETDLSAPDFLSWVDIDLDDFGMPILLNVIYWMIITAYLLLFVIPYLILGGFGRGIFYMIILGLSFLTENVLAEKMPLMFGLPKFTISSIIIIAFIVFANALFFDWIFDIGSSRDKVCLACLHHIDVDDLYCSKCGFVQP